MSKSTKTVVYTGPWLLITFIVLLVLKYGGVLPALPLWLVFLPLVPLALAIGFALLCFAAAGVLFLLAVILGK